MDLVLNNCYSNDMFLSLSQSELENVDGGSWLKIGAAVLGCVIIATSFAVGVAAGIGASVVGSPAVGVCAGIAATAGLVSIGASLLDYAGF
jgi:hypothetical protein